MKENEKRMEMKKILAFVYQEYPTKPISEALVSLWLRYLTGVSKQEAWLAAEFLLTQKTYGEPKLNDFLQCLKRIREYQPPKIRQAGTVTPLDYNPKGVLPDVPTDFEMGEFIRSKNPRKITIAASQLLEELKTATGRKELVHKVKPGHNWREDKTYAQTIGYTKCEA